MGLTYDVTAVTHDGQHVPLIARASYTEAHATARTRSMDKQWSQVQIRLPATGELAAVYVGGADCPYLAQR
jgi:hypothetical protein